MSNDSTPEYRISVGGNVSGQVAAGRTVHQVQHLAVGSGGLDDGERAQLAELIAVLEREVAEKSPPQLRAEAEEEAEAVRDAVTKDQPDLGRLEFAVRWFVRHLPDVMGAVTSIVISPVLGKLVQAGGDLLVNEFKVRFGHAPGSVPS
jgi:hypothetical protein